MPAVSGMTPSGPKHGPTLGVAGSGAPDSSNGHVNYVHSIATEASPSMVVAVALHRSSNRNDGSLSLLSTITGTALGSAKTPLGHSCHSVESSTDVGSLPGKVVAIVSVVPFVDPVIGPATPPVALAPPAATLRAISWTNSLA